MTHPFSRPRLAEILVAKRFVDPEALRPAEHFGDGALVDWLRRERHVDEAHLAQALADLFRLPYVDPGAFIVPAELFACLPAAHAQRLQVLPYARREGVLQVVISDPFDLTLGRTLEGITGLRVEFLIAAPGAVNAALKRSEGASAVLKDVSRSFQPALVADAGAALEDTAMLDEGASAVVRLINTILITALERRASDIHIETYDHGIEVKYRIDGVLYPAMESLDVSHQSALITRLKVMAEMDIAEKRIPQDGRFKLRSEARDIDFRVSVLPGVYGEDIVVRILDKSAIANDIGRLSLDGLGMETGVVKRFRRAIREPYGMVLITGPTGSGKTTTLYAALSELISGEEKIITIEDPVEYRIEGIVQVPVNEKKQLTFARGLRSILRHDPDKIMVGEIRDTETAQIAVQSALTGHLVFTTVHANNAFDVLGRFVHMGIDIQSFASALNCVMAQRLVRKLCEHCRVPTQLDGEALELSGLDPRRYGTHVWYEARGCERCAGTGYRGRVAVTELLTLSQTIRDMMAARRPTAELIQQARAEGMSSLRGSALALALAGGTTLREIDRVTFVE